MLKKKSFTVIIIIVSLVLGIYQFFTMKKEDEDRLRKLETKQSKYQNLRSYDNYFRYISGIVINKEISSGLYDKNALYIELNNGKKISISGTSRNYMYEVADLADFISLNDSMVKPIESDFVFIYRNDSVFFFKFNSIINKK